MRALHPSCTSRTTHARVPKATTPLPAQREREARDDYEAALCTSASEQAAMESVERLCLPAICRCTSFLYRPSCTTKKSLPVGEGAHI
eukprot:2559504-Pleurochrysis_carterae.AAC.1